MARKCGALLQRKSKSDTLISLLRGQRPFLPQLMTDCFIICLICLICLIGPSKRSWVARAARVNKEGMIPWLAKIWKNEILGFSFEHLKLKLICTQIIIKYGMRKRKKQQASSGSEPANLMANKDVPVNINKKECSYKFAFKSTLVLQRQ